MIGDCLANDSEKQNPIPGLFLQLASKGRALRGKCDQAAPSLFKEPTVKQEV